VQWVWYRALNPTIEHQNSEEHMPKICCKLRRDPIGFA
jgi:hypothetical protein